MHNDFTLFWRLYPNGKKVVFYYTYNEKGERVGPWTTKSKTLTAARVYCNKLLKAGALIPQKEKPLTFGEYSVGFWERDSDYVRNQDGRADITTSYIDNCKRLLANQILPFFADTPLADITSRDVNQWLLGFKNREITVGGKKEIREYKNTYANTALNCFRTMMGHAVEQGIITVNPCATVKKLKSNKKKIEILKVDEVRRLFPENWGPVWNGNEIGYIANYLASLTGMRAGEILGLRGEYVFDDYICVCGQFGPYGCGPTKTKETRNIPLIPEMIALLKKLMARNGKGYLFSHDGGSAPVSRRFIYDEFHKALERVGIGKTEIQRRGLSIHSWRHFLNTELQVQGLTLQQVQAVTGHKSEGMTDNYSHLDPRLIASVTEAQSVIAKGKKPGGGENGAVGMKAGRPELKIVKQPERETA